MNSKLSLFLLILIFPTSIFAQNITLDDLLKVQRTDAGSITDLLIDRNWKLIESEEETEENYGTMKWAYGINEYELEKAVAWLSISYSESIQNRVTLQVHNKSAYQKLMSKINSYGMKKFNYGLLDGASFNDYRGVNYVIRVAISADKNSANTTYLFMIWNRKDFEVKDDE